MVVGTELGGLSKQGGTEEWSRGEWRVWRNDQQRGVRNTEGFLHPQMSLFINHGWR